MIHGGETIIMTGLITNACVRGTSIDGIKMGYEVILIEDATETISAEIKESAIKELEGWGKVITYWCQVLILTGYVGVQVMNLTDWESLNPTGPQRRFLREL
jgi:isochorismate hydrolase